MTAGDTPRHSAEKTVVSRIMSRDTTRHGAFDTAFGLGHHGWQGESEADCRESE
jgi:hypothetical protein